MERKMARQLTVAAAEEQVGPTLVATEAMNGHDDIAVVEESSERVGGFGADLGRGDVLAHSGRLDDAVEGGTGPSSGFAGDLIGEAFEIAAVEGHEAERAPQIAVLDDPGQLEQRGEVDGVAADLLHGMSMPHVRYVGRMELRIFTEPQQGATYDDLLAVAKATEDAGFDAFFRSDHYLKMGDVSGLPGPTDAWTTLAGLARETSRIRLGTLVSPITFYQPGPLAITVAQVDQMSGGRVELGIGAGWYEAEHRAYGLPFPAMGERMDRLSEYLEQITGLWAVPEGATFDHEGVFHSFSGSPGLPKPAQRPGPPIIIGGRGPKRTPALTARYAAEFNTPFVPLADLPPIIDRARAACEAIDRDPDELVLSSAMVMCLGESEADAERRASNIGRDLAQMREDSAAGTAEEVRDRLGRYAELGISRIYLQVLDLADLDHVAYAGDQLL